MGSFVGGPDESEASKRVRQGSGIPLSSCRALLALSLVVLLFFLLLVVVLLVGQFDNFGPAPLS